MQPILVDNGKSPDDLYNYRLGFWLPADSPYGNLQLKQVKLCKRIDEANRRIRESWAYWESSRVEDGLLINAYDRHVYANEQAVYLLRRASDEIIALIWCLSEWELKKSYPTIIKIDCIGALLSQRTEERPIPLNLHIELLTAINAIANAFKHSFVQSDITLIGRDEPCVHALSLDYNKLASGMKFHNFSLGWVANAFTAFYKDAIDWLRKFSERHRA
ncbi:MAG: hypothetical protein WAS50_13055 [Nitrospira sp.]